MRKLNRLPSGSWIALSDKHPKEPGWYWIAGWFHEHPYRVEDPVLWELDDKDLEQKDRIPIIIGYEERNVIWNGPVLVPGFKWNTEICYRD